MCSRASRSTPLRTGRHGQRRRTRQARLRAPGNGPRLRDDALDDPVRHMMIWTMRREEFATSQAAELDIEAFDDDGTPLPCPVID